ERSDTGSSSLAVLSSANLTKTESADTISAGLTGAAITAATIWSDSFETDTTTQYYERNTPGGTGTWGRASGTAYTGSWALKSLAQSGSTSNSNWWVGFGKLPAGGGWPDFYQPSGVD